MASPITCITENNEQKSVSPPSNPISREVSSVQLEEMVDFSSENDPRNQFQAQESSVEERKESGRSSFSLVPLLETSNETNREKNSYPSRKLEIQENSQQLANPCDEKKTIPKQIPIESEEEAEEEESPSEQSSSPVSSPIGLAQVSTSLQIPMKTPQQQQQQQPSTSTSTSQPKPQEEQQSKGETIDKNNGQSTQLERMKSRSPMNSPLDSSLRTSSFNSFSTTMEEFSSMSSMKEPDSQYGFLPQRVPSATKSSFPAIVQWLEDNYEAHDGSSLPRSSLYSHYLHFCNAAGLEPANAASFGKLIRSVFPNLKTRRLGTRGHSKYHYYGIKIKDSSELCHGNETVVPSYNTSAPIENHRESSSTSTSTSSLSSLLSSQTHPSVKKHTKMRSSTLSLLRKELLDNNQASLPITSPHIPVSVGGSFSAPTTLTITGSCPVQLAEFTLPDNFVAPRDISLASCQTFMTLYRQHCQSLVEAAYRHQFPEIEKMLRLFWQTRSMDFRNLLSAPEIVDIILTKDHLTYRAMSTAILPNVLQALPVSVPQSIRQFAKQLEPWLSIALEGIPSPLSFMKMNLIRKFSQSLHKQASLNHLTQAARAVLQNQIQVAQMMVDWNRMDMDFIHEQSAWICQCSEDFVQSAQADFRRLLSERASLEQWALWLQDVVNKFIGKCMNDSRELLSCTQQLILKWSFYSTMVIRDLTIRNAPSFGSFHLLRTLFDEYIFFLVETKFASFQTTMQQAPSQQSQGLSRYGSIWNYVDLFNTVSNSSSSSESNLSQSQISTPTQQRFPIASFSGGIFSDEHFMTSNGQPSPTNTLEGMFVRERDSVANSDQILSATEQEQETSNTISEASSEENTALESSSMLSVDFDSSLNTKSSSSTSSSLLPSLPVSSSVTALAMTSTTLSEQATSLPSVYSEEDFASIGYNNNNNNFYTQGTQRELQSQYGNRMINFEEFRYPSSVNPLLLSGLERINVSSNLSNLIRASGILPSPVSLVDSPMLANRRASLSTTYPLPTFSQSTSSVDSFLQQLQIKSDADNPHKKARFESSQMLSEVQ